MRKKDTMQLSHRKLSKTRRPEHWHRAHYPWDASGNPSKILEQLGVRSLCLIQDEAYAEDVY